MESVSPLERADQLECHTDTRQAGKRIGIVRPLAVHDRLRVRQVFVALVVIGNDDLHAELACDGNLLVGCARVHRDERARALLIQLLHRRDGSGRSRPSDGWECNIHICALAAQIIHQCARCRDAVPRRNHRRPPFLSAIYYLADDLDCLIHIGQTERIMQSAHIAAQVIRRSLRCVDTAPTAPPPSAVYSPVSRDSTRTRSVSGEAITHRFALILNDPFLSHGSSTPSGACVW